MRRHEKDGRCDLRTRKGEEKGRKRSSRSDPDNGLLSICLLSGESVCEFIM